MYETRSLTSLWAKATFNESLSSLTMTKNLYTATSKCFTSLKIWDKTVNGYACENLPKPEEGHTGVKILYSDVFHKLLGKGNFTPTEYLIRLIDLYIKCNGDPLKLNGFIARGIRTLTSVLREPDFAFFIKEYLKDIDQDVKTSINPQQDSGDNTDVLLKIKNMEYRSTYSKNCCYDLIPYRDYRL